jgi:hypothetical protein
MPVDAALYKIIEGRGDELGSFLSAFPTQLLLRYVQVKGTADGALGKVEYAGYATPGTTKAQPRWLIKKFIYDADGFLIDSVFADGEAKFTKVWNDHSTITYPTT